MSGESATSARSRNPRRNRRRPRSGNSRQSNRPRSRRGSGGSRSDERKPGEHPKAPAKKKGIISSFFAKILGKDKPAKNGKSEHRRPVEGKERGTTTRSSERTPRTRAPRPERETSRDDASLIHEVVTPKLYVGNLSYDLVESDLFDLFSKVGQVKNVEIVRDRHSNSKGFGFVEMHSIETAKEAAEKLHRADVGGRQLVVSGAKNV